MWYLRFLSCIDSLRFSFSRMFCMFTVLSVWLVFNPSLLIPRSFSCLMAAER